MPHCLGQRAGFHVPVIHGQSLVMVPPPLVSYVVLPPSGIPTIGFLQGTPATSFLHGTHTIVAITNQTQGLPQAFSWLLGSI